VSSVDRPAWKLLRTVSVAPFVADPDAWALQVAPAATVERTPQAPASLDWYVRLISAGGALVAPGACVVQGQPLRVEADPLTGRVAVVVAAATLVVPAYTISRACDFGGGTFALRLAAVTGIPGAAVTAEVWAR